MAGFDSERARRSFGIPEGFAPMAMIVLGFSAPEESLSPETRQREAAPRERRPLGELFFAGRWEAPFVG